MNSRFDAKAVELKGGKGQAKLAREQKSSHGQAPLSPWHLRPDWTDELNSTAFPGRVAAIGGQVPADGGEDTA
jgi:hypothetical protein